VEGSKTLVHGRGLSTWHYTAPCRTTPEVRCAGVKIVAGNGGVFSGDWGAAFERFALSRVMDTPLRKT